MSRGRVRGGLIMGAIVSIALVVGLVAWAGWRDVAQAAAGIGVGGFLLFCATWLLVLGTLGLAWAASAPGAGRASPGVFIWGRFLREAASEVLPFSQIGGLAAGLRGVIAGGVRQALVYASVLVDITAELIAQVIYTLLGLALTGVRLSGRLAGAPLYWVLGGLGLLVVSVVAFLFFQRGAVRALGRLAARWLPASAAHTEAVAETLEGIYARPWRVALAVCLHVCGWIGSSAVSWLALSLMGLHITLWAVVALESLMFAVRNVGFALPAALGVQEGAYMLLGPLFGLPVHEALALSLLKRARDVAIGAPILLAWQVLEGRALIGRGARRAGPKA